MGRENLDAVSTVVARLTPAGRAAIACLGVSGPRAWEIVRGLMRREQPENPGASSVFVDRLGDGGRADEVVVLVREPGDVEIHCHGGTEVVRMIESLVASRGATVVSAADWAGLRGGEMADLLSRCLTPRTAGIVLDQIAGAFDRATDRERLRRLIPVGQHVATPWTVALVGPPNVGKSSLANALAGFARSLVAETPGTTRDVVSTLIALDGWPISLLDTAGVRAGGETLETMGIERGRAAADAADLVLRVADATGDPPGPVAANELLVINKTDCPAAWDIASREGVRVSARTGAGLEQLIAAIVSRLVPEPPSPGEGVPVTPRQIEEADKIAERRSGFPA